MSNTDISIREMIDITSEQLEYLRTLQKYDQATDEEFFNSRETIVAAISNLYAYKKVKPGFAVSSDSANPVTNLLNRLFSSTIAFVERELNEATKSNYILKSNAYQHTGKGHIIIRANSKINPKIKNHPQHLSFSDYSVEIGRISVNSNEFKINSPDKLKPKKATNYSKDKDDLEYKIKLYSEILNIDTSYKDLLNLMMTKSDITPNLLTRIQERYSLRKIRSNPANIENLLSKSISSLKEIIESEEYSKLCTNHYNSIVQIAIDDLDLVREILLTMGYRENNDKYFAYD